MNIFKTQKTSGFTLIELLVVISIISLLTSIVLSSLNSAKIKARDAKRVSDLHQIRLALEMYRNDHGGNYPANNSTWQISNDNTKWNGGWLGQALKPYISSLPIDPINKVTLNDGGLPRTSGNYAYGYLSNYGSCPLGTCYDLITLLEDTGSQNRCGIKKYKKAYDGNIWCTPGGYSGQIYSAQN